MMDDKATALFWVNPANHRYYAVDLQQDLLADWILMRTNGKLGTRMRQVKQRVCKNYLEGLNLIEDIRKKGEKEDTCYFLAQYHLALYRLSLAKKAVPI